MSEEVGKVLTFVRVRFPGNAKSFPFIVGKRKFQYGSRVLAMSDRGMAVGYINSFPYEREVEESMLPLKSIVRNAEDEDLEREKEENYKENEVKTICRDLIEKYKLDMELTHLEYTQYGKKAVFYFTSPQRVDFRNLVKDLVRSLKIRIELRQISVRDRTASIGGVGPCGRSLCCGSFLTRYGQVNIKMPKNQNMALNPTRLNGVCGQLKCCLQYEDEAYSELREKLPKEGQFIQTKSGDKGKVERIFLMKEEFVLLTDRGDKKRYTSNQFSKDFSLPKGWRFPESFDSIDDKTEELIS